MAATSEQVDRVAVALRLAYAEADPRVRGHIESVPWGAMGDDRRRKWRAMARAAIELSYRILVEEPGMEGSPF